MFQNSDQLTRPPGRPRARPDCETRDHIVLIASECFRADGYANTGMGTIARIAGVSTRTVYRLFPGKQDLLADVISRQIDRFMMEIDLSRLSGLSVREGLTRLMTAYGILTLSDDAVRMARLVVSESSRFPEVSSAFYEKAVVPTNKVIEGWLRERMELGEISGNNPAEASGILRGMMTMEPQRASLLSQQQAMTAAEIERRARECVDRFLGGCVRRVTVHVGAADDPCV